MTRSTERTQSPRAFKYLPAIDGLRALAVVAVLIFHLDKRFLSGGFVGVDVFFVISGYLITSIIYSEILSDNFSLTRFYQRRISRIFPVFFTVIIVVLLAASIIYTSQDFASAGALAFASSLSVTNLKLMFQGNYFEVSPDSQPFLHFWSLSVEEQFYLILPLSLVVVLRFGLIRRHLLLVLYVAAAMSFFLCVAMTPARPTWAFYLLPTRAWELLAGSILAVSTCNAPQSKTGWRANWAIIGLCMIVLSFVFIGESVLFPGYVALLPVIGSILVLRQSSDTSSFCNRMLSMPWVVFIGRLSYSLYLWHWPIFCFVDYSLFTESAAIRITLKVCLTCVFSLCSYFLIEKPFRSYLNIPQRKKFVFIGFSVGVAAFALA